MIVKNVLNGTVAFLMFAVGISALLALPTMILWNSVVTSAIDGTHRINFFQGFGLNLLVGILFRGIGAIDASDPDDVYDDIP